MLQATNTDLLNPKAHKSLKSFKSLKLTIVSVKIYNFLHKLSQ